MRRGEPLAALVLAIAVAAPAAAATTDFPPGYTAHHTHAELRADLKQIASAHPDIISLHSMGRSFEGRKLSGTSRISGGDEGTRTPDPCDANAVLSQLSYIPTGQKV